MSGRFALSADHPDGCSPCFCSGVSSDCEEQGGLSRAAVSHTHTHFPRLHHHGNAPPDPPCVLQLTLDESPALLAVVSQSNLQGVVSGVYQQGGAMLLDTRQLNASGLAGPLYWRLPPQFEGQQVCREEPVLEAGRWLLLLFT